MKKEEYKAWMFESVFLFITVVILIYVYTLRSASLYKYENANIKNNEGFLYFHSYYGEENGKEFDSLFDIKEQNRILNKIFLELNKSKYNYLLDYSLGIEGVNTIIINGNTIDYFELNAFVEEGDKIDNEINIYSSQINIPIWIGYNLKSEYKLGDIIEKNLYGNKIKYVVKGIISQNAKIDFEYFNDQLDDLIIVPQINFMNSPETRDEYILQNYMLYCQCNGYFRYDRVNSYDEIKKFCDDISKENGVKWKTSNKVENKLENVTIPFKDSFLRLGIIVIYIIMGMLQMIYGVWKNKYYGKLFEQKYPLIKIQTKHILQTICVVYVIYKIAFRLVKFRLMNTVYYEFLFESRVYICIYMGIYICLNGIIYWKVLNRIRRLKA